MKTQEEIDERREYEWFDDIIQNKLCLCKNCQWSGYEKGDFAITCGHHIQNFSPESSCASWTDPQEKDLLEIRAKRTKELRAKMKGTLKTIDNSKQ